MTQWKVIGHGIQQQRVAILKRVFKANKCAFWELSSCGYSEMLSTEWDRCDVSLARLGLGGYSKCREE